MQPDKRGFVQKVLSLGEARDEDFQRHMTLTRNHSNCHPAMLCRRVTPNTPDARPR